MAESITKRRADQDENDDLMQLVGFKIDREQFGVNILMVQEIIRSAPITPVPNSPEFVEGVINLRGDILPVIDLRKRLNFELGDDGDDTWILILDIDGRVTGFIVDLVTNVIKIEESEIEAAPEIATSGLENQYINGVVDIGGTLMILLDFNRILQTDELIRLKSLNTNQ
ncbi:MAG: chemotaxis protein CheW [Gammaproteobacteria bacterium]|nr:chemotaxis protein CheW [Gammaproteobacteria bacterium]